MIDFPNSPTLNEEFTSGNRTWKWNGEVWNILSYGGDNLLSSADYVRPAEWLTLPLAAANEVRALHAVFDQTENYVVIKMVTSDNSAYTINWGDGNTTTALSNTNTTYNYSYNSSALDGTLTTRGYKQAIITITPVGSATFTLCDLGQKITSPTGMQTYATGFLDVNINLPNLTATGQRLIIGSSAVRHRQLERVYIGSWGGNTVLAGLFTYCSALKSINETDWNMSNITNVQGMFFSCGIESVDGTNWNMSKVGTFMDMFRDCPSLRRVNCQNWVTSTTTNITNFFMSCPSLVDVDVSGWNTANCTNFAYLFQGCRSLHTIDVSNWNTAKVTTINNMFDACWSLEKVDISSWSLPLCTNGTAAFQNCVALRKVGACDLSALTTLGTIFTGCTSLTSCDVTGMKVNVDFTNCRLSTAALNQIYTNLASVATARTITVTGNYGNVADDTSIAIAKNWTVTG